ncbi:MAG: YfhO family protein [Thermomicrobiales bacterium]
MVIASAIVATPAKREDSVSARETVIADSIGIGVLVALTAAVAWNYLHFDDWLARTDILTQYLPWYAFAGEQLKSLTVPGWNPHQLSGFPAAGDPQSGWMYLPAMVPFALLSPVTAFKTYVVFQLAFAGISTYVFARVLGMTVIASLVAASAFEFGPFLFRDTYCCTIEAQLSTWIPLSLLGVELAVRSHTWSGRTASWSVAGIGISQMLAGFLGQGSYNGLLLIGSYIVYRALVSPSIGSQMIVVRLRQMVVHGVAIFVIGLGLGAAGLLPRLDVNRHTDLSGGQYENVQTLGEWGWGVDTLLVHLVGYTDALPNHNRRFYLGGVTIVLALLAPFVARRRYATPYFVALSAVAMTMTLKTTPLHRLFYVLPYFRSLHRHTPYGILNVMLIAPAILAGATVDALARRQWRPRMVPFIALPLLLLAALQSEHQRSGWIAHAQMTVAIITGVLFASAFLAFTRIGQRLPGASVLYRLMPMLLLGALLWEPAGREFVASSHDMRVHRQAQQAIEVNAAATDLGGAGEFLQQQDLSAEPFRYVGYDGIRLRTKTKRGESYQFGRKLPEIQMLLVSARAIRLGLYDIQGYNPIQLRRYVEFMVAINDGVEQNYHDANVLPVGIDSPLFDLLNVRYIVIPYPPTSASPVRTDLAYLKASHRQVFDNGQVQVLANDNALPRAWIVHDARKVERDQVLDLLTSDTIDPRRTVLLETDSPPLGPPLDPTTDSIEFKRYEPNQVSVNVRAGTSGIVVFSEVYDEGWHAYVDGKRVPLSVADYVLRAVPVEAGEHRVELRYEPLSLRLGGAISAVFCLIVLVSFGALLYRVCWEDEFRLRWQVLTHPPSEVRTPRLSHHQAPCRRKIRTSPLAKTWTQPDPG